MVWQAKRRADAAKLAGMTDKSLRSALRKAHVMAYYNGELEVLRAGNVRATSIASPKFGDAKSRREEFKRVRQQLQARSLIGVNGELIWKA